MNTSTIINEEARGFAGIIKNALLPLNSNPVFKEKFSSISLKILLNASNLDHAALIIINKGEIGIKSVKNKPPGNLDQNLIGWDAFLEMNSELFLMLAMNRLSLLGVMRNWMAGKIKMRGLRKLLTLLKVFKLLS